MIITKISCADPYIHDLVIYREKCNEVTDQHLNPIKVLHATEDVMSENAIMVADGGDFVGTAAYILRY